MNGRARRMAEATRSPIFDRPSPHADEASLEAGEIRIPRRGETDIEIDGRSIHLTHLERVLWPATGFTKAELVAYMLTVAPVLLPHLVDRPLTVGRFPGGVDGRGFAQSEIPGRPSWIRAVPIHHSFLGRWPELARPTAVLFDLDPSAPADLLTAAEAALALREERGRAARARTPARARHGRDEARGA